MTIELVKKRSGSIVVFDPSRITVAIQKAYAATQTPITDETLQALTTVVMDELTATYGDSEHIPTVETIQDIVEKKIAEKGDFEVAKSYILYRQERAEIRFEKQQELLERINRAELKVKKRSGKIVALDMAEIRAAVEKLAAEYGEIVDVDAIVESSKLNLYDGITTSEINKAIVMALKVRVERDPIFSDITARFLINDLTKEVLGVDEFTPHFDKIFRKAFAEQIKKGVDAKRLDARLLGFDLEKLAAALDPKRDHLFEYMGLQVLYDRYFLRDDREVFLEVPQYFWMRIAMGIALLEEQKTDVAINFYNTISQMLYVPSTPTLLHSGTSHPQMSSCFLSTVEDDLKHIFKVVGDNAQLSKYSGGVANDWTNTRATNAWIKSINTGSQGVIPFLKIVDATTASINRSGKRRGATAVYLETWHLDIEDFLDLRKNTGDDRRRTHDTNTANWIPDLFMKRVQEGGQWTLFSPHEVPELHHIYGKAFEEKYVEYEKKADEGKLAMHKRIPAADLWRKMIMMLFETGHPWITFKDPCNIRSPQDHVGVVHCSNLCTEITLNTSAEETAVCNIGSVNLVRHIRNGAIDRELLARTVKEAIRMLDNVIDISFYPTIEGKVSNERHRPIGLGIMGTQDAFFELDLAFDSEEAVKFSDETMEFISWHAIMSSSELAREKSPYSSFKGSKWDRNLFPVDTLRMLEDERGISTGIAPVGVMDWAPVREHVKQYGMRNSNTMAIAPTATIANITGCLPSVEPIYKNLYVKSNFSGEFTVVNEYLVRDLKKLNLWNPDMLEKIKHFDGNLEAITDIPLSLRMKYKEVFQIEPYWIMAHAAHRGKWIDQSQSINVFLSTQSGRAISDAYMMAWKMGLKTTYYLRSLGASSVEKSTVDINKYKEGAPETATINDVVLKKPTVVVAGEVCESCQ
ncbi:MAG: ribonucleoside-diphosphate reductase subunit alpha [Candidatus Pacebacteria bacterium]|nr:ribonucleoside-diphosphate reductase subunit alpha [Candidatus Paceibacterota bacterium]